MGNTWQKTRRCCLIRHEAPSCLENALSEAARPDISEHFQCGVRSADCALWCTDGELAWGLSADVRPISDQQFCGF